MDIVSRVKRHPRHGETIKSKNFSYIPGGKGANQAIAAHRLGGNILMLGKVGQDAFGQKLLQFFKKENINTTNIRIDTKTTTGAAFVAVNNKSENIIYVSSGANNTLSPTDTKRIRLKKQDIVSATLEIPIETTEQLFKRAKKTGAATILNAAPASLAAKKLFPFVDYLIVNETELAIFARTKIPTTKHEAIHSMKKLREHTHNIIATLGNKGLIALIGKEIIILKGHKVKAIDTTAAGDCFVGAFATALQDGKTIRQALAFANGAAAVSVQRLGASSSLPTKKEVEKFLSNK